jgi:hypothetical protein
MVSSSPIMNLYRTLAIAVLPVGLAPAHARRCHHSNLGAWHGTSSAALASVACTRDAEVLEVA